MIEGKIMKSKTMISNEAPQLCRNPTWVLESGVNHSHYVELVAPGSGERKTSFVNSGGQLYRIGSRPLMPRET